MKQNEELTSEVERLQCALELADMRINALVDAKAQAERRLFDATETQIAIAAHERAPAAPAPSVTVDTPAFHSLLAQIADAAQQGEPYDYMITGLTDYINAWHIDETAQAVAQALEGLEKASRLIFDDLRKIRDEWQARAEKAEQALEGAQAHIKHLTHERDQFHRANVELARVYAEQKLQEQRLEAALERAQASNIGDKNGKA